MTRKRLIDRNILHDAPVRPTGHRDGGSAEGREVFSADDAAIGGGTIFDRYGIWTYLPPPVFASRSKKCM